MGINVLGGFISDIFSGAMDFVLGIFEVALEFVVKWIVAPFIMLVIDVAMYVLSAYIYSFVCFLLSLIDYVEMLFRMLAGLETNSGAQLTLANSNIESNDLLMQVLMSDAVRDVFLSMCIVGLFLLLITTIFQIIKVEYTTEGSKNAKGPILTKAFKGICNMVLLPILVIFGVFLGNQVLDLLDKATKPAGDNPTISGQLFVTAASDAFYYDSDLRVLLATTLPDTVIMQVLINAIPIVVNSVQKMANESWAPNNVRDPAFTDEQKEEIETRFVNRTAAPLIEGEAGWVDADSTWTGLSPKHTYHNIGVVTHYYNYSQINYVLLIVGGTMVLKCLYYSCFGMIARLYQCAMLFIISPAVIGMTPVNEGNLGKWRTRFIGQVLSAYGVVVALNLFFILVKIFLSIEFSFASNDASDMMFGQALMESLLKSIFVISGCIMIEKFSKEIGGYFGAEDALSAGKELEKGVMDQATKGIKLAASAASFAATGGASILPKAMGMASKIKSGAIAGAAASKAAGGNAFAGGIKGALGLKVKPNGEVALAEDVKAAKTRIDTNESKLKKLREQEDYLARYEANPEALKDPEMQKDYKELKKSQQARLSEIASLQGDVNSDNAIIANAQKLGDYNKGIKAKRDARSLARKDRIIAAGGFLEAAGNSFTDEIMPKFVADQKKYYKDMVKDAGSHSDAVKYAQEGIDKRASDRRKDHLEEKSRTYTNKEDGIEDSRIRRLGRRVFGVNTGGIIGDTEAKKNILQEEKVGKVMVDTFKVHNLSVENTAKGLQEEYAKYSDIFNNANASQADKFAAQQRMATILNKLSDLGIDDKKYTISGGKIQFAADIEYGVNFGQVEQILKKAFAKGGKGLTEQVMRDMIKELTEGQTAEYVRTVEQLFQKVVSQINNAK